MIELLVLVSVALSVGIWAGSSMSLRHTNRALDELKEDYDKAKELHVGSMKQAHETMDRAIEHAQDYQSKLSYVLRTLQEQDPDLFQQIVEGESDEPPRLH